MMRNTAIGILHAFLLVLAQSTSIPSSWKACRQNDPNLNACLKDSISSALTSLIPGNPTFKIRPLDPLHLHNATFVLKEPDVEMTILFTDIIVSNFVKFFKIESVVSDWKTMTIKLTVPDGAIASCFCHIPDGSVFMGRSIKGDGPCEFLYGNLAMNWRLKFAEKDVKGVTYYDVKDFNFEMETDKLTFKFANLQSVDAQTEDMEKLINNNWKVFWNPLKHGVRSVLGPVGSFSSNKIFGAIPKNEISPP